MGGYFVINGNEKIVRMLLLPRRNHVRMQDENRPVVSFSLFGVSECVDVSRNVISEEC